MSEAPLSVKIEQDETVPLAVVYGKGALEHAVGRILRKQHLRVVMLREPTEALPVLEKPAYIFFFTDNDSLPHQKAQFSEALQSATHYGAKVVLILNNSDESTEKILLSEQGKSSWPVAVMEIRGEIVKTNEEAVESAASKIIRSAFSSRSSSRQVIMGKENVTTHSQDLTLPLKKLSTQDVFDRLKKFEKKTRISFKSLILPAIFLGLISLVFAPVLLIGVPSLRAFIKLDQARRDLVRGKFKKAYIEAVSAKNGLSVAKKTVQIVGMSTFGISTPLESYFDTLLLGETAADIIVRAAKLGPKGGSLASSLFSGEVASVDLATRQLRQEIGPINEDLGLIEAQSQELVSGLGGKVLAFAGIPADKMKLYLGEIPRIRASLVRAEKILNVWSELVPAQNKKTYLVVFQNSAELRPTGGFIGSYALVNFDSGKLSNWQVHDIYSADGQLRGQVAPPDEILHFLGQPSWFMRDSNWAADWPLTSKRLLWFLEKETGQKADGVIGVNLGAVQKLLAATGPLSLPDLNQTVSADDFFQKAEYASEINFFAGSTQKKDFLGAAAKALLEKVTSDSDKNWPSFGKALISSLDEKDVLLFFNSPAAQTAVLENGWGGSIETADCKIKNANCLMLVEANFGANKANYFIKRSLRISSTIGKAGEIETTVMVRYRNDSPSETWPGGVYKNYLRFLVPQGSQLISYDLGDGRKPALSAILTAAELAKVNDDQFFVFQSSENIYTSFGSLIEIPIQSEKIISFTYRPFSKVSLTLSKPIYTLYLLRQPGAGPDLVDFSLEYPGFLTPDSSRGLENLLPLVFPQKLIYNSDLSEDRIFEVKFANSFR